MFYLTTRKDNRMAEILGFMAGAGMLALVGALIVVFLRQMGWVSRDAARLWGRCAVLVCGAGALYAGTALVYYLAVYGKLEGELTLDVVFRSPYLRAMLSALESPQGVGPISTVFAWLGFALGKVFFGQFVFCGIVLAWGMTMTSLFLMQLRLRKIADGLTARDAAFLLLCLPGSVFFLLPGAAPLCLLICAVAFYLAGNRIKAWKIRLSPIAYGWALSMCGVLSAAVVICLAEGKLV